MKLMKLISADFLPGAQEAVQEPAPGGRGRQDPGLTPGMKEGSGEDALLPENRQRFRTTEVLRLPNVSTSLFFSFTSNPFT